MSIFNEIHIFDKLYNVNNVSRSEVALDDAQKKVTLFVYLHRQPQPDCFSKRFSTEADKKAVVEELEAWKTYIQGRLAAATAKKEENTLVEHSRELTYQLWQAGNAANEEELKRLRDEEATLKQQRQAAANAEYLLRRAAQESWHELLRVQREHSALQRTLAQSLAEWQHDRDHGPTSRSREWER